jgi:endonuclease III
VSKKSEHVAKLLARIEPRWPLPTPVEGASLLEQGLYAVLLWRLEPKAALRGLESLRKAYTDWNEVRVAQAQEIAAALKAGQAGVAAAGDVRAYLQEVFQRSHGLDLDFLRDDPEATKRFLSILPFMGMGLAHYLLWVAEDGALPVSTALARVLDRVGLMNRISNPKKARAALAPVVPKGKELEFAIKIGEVATRWCDAKKPLCHECPIVDDCKYGKKAYREWRLQQERLEAQRVREEARMAALRKKEEARRAREEARARKKAEADAKKRAREAERRAKAEARRKGAEEKRQAAARAREQARRQREAESLRKKAEAEAARKARQAEAAKKASERKAAAKKAAAERKAAARKAASKKAASKKAASKKKTARKAVKKPARKPAKKVPARKRTVRKGRARKA